MGRLSYDFKAYVALREAADSFTKDATPGKIVNGTVLNVTANSVIVSIGTHVSICPQIDP